jgi:general bacterial porin, GBP family
MKRTIILGGLAVLFATPAFADDVDSITLYGILDVAVGTVEHSGNASSTFPSTVNPVSKTKFQNSVWGMFNGGMSDSRWGLRGNENLGGGMSAFFDLESGIDVNSGTLNNAAGSIAGSNTSVGAPSALSGQLFNRAAYVGLKQDQYGSLEFGRTPTFGFYTVVNYDPMFASQLFSPLGFSGSYYAGGITEGSRTNNNVVYTNHFGPVNVGLSYSFGGQAGTFGAGSTWGANLGYEAHGFGIQASWYEARDAIHSTSLTGANAPNSPLIGTSVGPLTNNNDEDVLIAAKYTFGHATVKAGYERYELKAPTDPVVAGSTANYFGYIGTVTNQAVTAMTNVYFAGGDYRITPSFDLGVAIYDTQSVQAAKVAGGNQLQYSLLADYQLSTRTDIYAGYMFSKYNGSAFNGYQPTNYIVATGIRTVF